MGFFPRKLPVPSRNFYVILISETKILVVEHSSRVSKKQSKKGIVCGGIVLTGGQVPRCDPYGPKVKKS